MSRTPYRDEIREANAVARAVGWRAAAWVIAVVLLIGGISAGAWWFKVATSDVKGAGDATAIANDGRNRVNAQEWFHGQYNQILATDRQIDESARRLAEATAERNESDRQFWRDTLSGQRHRCADMVAAYNAEAGKVSRGQWRDPVLPYAIDTTDPSTDCKETTR